MRIACVAYRCLFVVSFCLCAVANAEHLGLVLSGGGAMGAYEVGVWQELQTAGLASNVTVVSGTSVGALNAALFATRPDAAERLWFEKMDEVFTINTNRVGESIQKTLDDVSKAVEVAKETGENWKGVVSFLGNSLLRGADNYVKIKSSRESYVGYIDSSKLAIALNETLPRVWSAASPAVYVTAVEKGGSGVSKTWRLNTESHERRVLMLRASAAIPVGFDTVVIDGTPYVDGGWETEGGNNAPLDPILYNHPDIKTVVIVYLIVGEHRRARNREVASASGVRLIEIIPTEDISGVFGVGGVFDTSPETAHRLIELGRKDARKVLAEAGMERSAGG